jgi:hypothetical protein
MTTKDKNLFVALPIYRSVDYHTVLSLLGLVSGQLTKSTWGMAIHPHAGECPIGRARNDLTHEFLQNKDYTHILFIDSDIVFSYEQVERILSHDEDIVGGFYPFKSQGKARVVCNSFNNVDVPNENGLVKMKYMGTGFLRVSRRVFEVMIQEIGNQIGYRCDQDGISWKHDFWRMGVTKVGKEEPRWLSEDWQFCQFALDCGFEIWADSKILVQHSGQVLFPLQTQISDLYPKESIDRMISARTKSVVDNAGAAASSPAIAPA